MQKGYLLDGLDLVSEYGIYIMKVSGFLDLPKRKGETEYDWEDEDGVEAFTDAADIFWDARDVRLKCFIKATSRADFLTKLNAFKAKLISSGLHTIKLSYGSMVYNVYFRDKSALRLLTQWNGDKLIGKFYIPLREPRPVIAPTFVFVTAPNGGESWEQGEFENIIWGTSGSGNVKIEVSIDGGINWETVTLSTANDGSFSWEIFCEASESTLIKISDENGYDVSDVTFIVLPIYFIDSDGLQFVTSDNENFTVRLSVYLIDSDGLQFVTSDGKNFSVIKI